MQQKDVEKRRKARQRKARRRRLKMCFVLFIIAALITLVIMCFTVFFPIKRISVSGSKIYSKAEIIKASGLTTKDNLFVVSEEKIEENIRKKLPYVDSIELKRNIPDAVVLTITEAKEQCCFCVDDKYFVVSESGYVLKSQAERPENAFEIVTSGVSCKVGERVKYKNSKEEQLVSTITNLFIVNKINVDEIDVTSLLSLSANVENRFYVNFGSDEYLEEKIAHLQGMIESIGDRSGDINLSMWTPDNSQGSFVEKSE